MQRAFAVATLQDNLRRVADVALRLCASALKIIPLWDGSGFKDCILTTPGSQKTEASPPVYEYGNSSSRGYPAGDGTLVFFIEGMSYYQRMLGLKKLGIKYFDTSSQGFKEYLFRIPKQVCEKFPPEIICFRLECWQNGALAGVYNSKSPGTLNAKGIPVDWFVRGKYPSRFNYSLMNSAPWE